MLLIILPNEGNFWELLVTHSSCLQLLWLQFLTYINIIQKGLIINPKHRTVNIHIFFLISETFKQLTNLMQTNRYI